MTRSQSYPLSDAGPIARAAGEGEGTGALRVLDLFSGIGTIALALAPSAGEVWGIEVVEQAVSDALVNVKAQLEQRVATALRSGTQEELALEMADVLAWLVTLANAVGVDLEAAMRDKYGTGCPGCGQSPCVCPPSEKP